MNLTAAVAAALLLARIPPYPAPKLIQPTDDLKCDWGPIESIKPDATQLIMRTQAGPFTLDLAPGVKVAGPDGRQMGGAAELRTGQSVRVYYVVEKGAKAREIDML